ncbi:type II toxin-antitoxin system RelE/ParE family toxin [Runella limosa]|uniref:type II toxin-antitoxin system RelE/ParE family toxin n=1 Tax=Runella limosa TaxID=370978 RepID=UPI0003FE9BF8|nr:type II toxin-antitoxin system RelE/ParE family toxin [Runella limosa]
MSFEIIPISPFQRQAKRLIKKFPSLKGELLNLIERLKDQPLQGTSLGDGCYKIRLSISSKNKGKSGGARVITCVYINENELYLLSIYDKSERSSLNDKELKELITIVQELK